MKERTRRNLQLLKDHHAVSPVLSEVLMIIVVAVAAGFLTAYAYTLLHTMDTGAINIMVEGARAGSSSVTIVHMGGDKVVEAFTVNDAAPVYYLNESGFNEMSSRCGSVARSLPARQCIAEYTGRSQSLGSKRATN
jgi:FlaG/FlaF family flagellin (archaellin)